MSLYEKNFCLKCENSVISEKNSKCLNFCPKGQKNPLTGFCVNCQKKNCEEISKKIFFIKQKKNLIFEISSNFNKILNFEKKLKIFKISKKKKNRNFWFSNF